MPDEPHASDRPVTCTVARRDRKQSSLSHLHSCAGIVIVVPTVRRSRHRHARETPPDEHLALMADLFGLLADRTRLRLLMQLQQFDEVCVSDLAAEANISESAVSHALRLLRAHGLVDTRRDGRWVFYSLVDEHVHLLLDATLKHLERDH
jgi:DNA-binding transcriptional ArsR family regulator